MKTVPLCVVASLLALGGSGAAAREDWGALTQGNLQSRIELLKKITLKNLMPVEGGKFLMGDFGPIHSKEKLPYSDSANDKVLHEVELSSYKIGAYKITFREFDVYSDATGQPRISQAEHESRFRNTYGIPAWLSWFEARDYCQWIGKELGLKMDLPTEAQWEYAARNRGQFLVYPTDNGEFEEGRNFASYEDLMKFVAQKDGQNFPEIMPVGLYPPNGLGLYDLISNGNEWIFDWYQPKYSAGFQKNPTGPKSGTLKVQRSSTSYSDNLAVVSMTFSRRGEIQKEEPYDPGHGLEKSNPHLGNSARCALNFE